MGDMNILEDRLKAALNKFYDYSNKRIPKETREAIYKDLMAIIGDDEEQVLPHPLLNNYDGVQRCVGRNQFRAELRQKISEYCGVKG